ncbi:LysM peptidoglycan-binding domain-containing protein [Halopseudomonas salegens]|uniref:LysM domain-containing protein n=1 Tax=Halopseudomonas salegens TaxID=1434072 RepID=A0A1H2HKV3_9GAMM|nr:LysM domain-containing protein [Halopseudomonas salegens]SDU32507.1 LysM domain-containing protein [Halopseudomonas salegens]
MVNSTDYLEYRVKPGDSLSMIMSRFYAVSPRCPGYSGYLHQILSMNPHIRDPDLIRAGSILRLTTSPGPITFAPPIPLDRLPHRPIVEPAFTPIIPIRPIQTAPRNFMLEDVPPQDELDYWVLSWFAENTNYLVVPGSVALGAKTNLLSPANIALIERVDDLYVKYKTGQIQENQYAYQRRKALNQLRANIGPMERLLFGNQTTHQAIRIARGGGVPANQNIIQHRNRLRRLASYGRYGGYLLTGVGLTASCLQIAAASSRHEKNEIFVETIASTGVGLVGGLIVGLYLASNPVGWGTALIIAAGSAAVSFGGGRIAGTVYTLSGTEVDLVSGAGVDAVCR